MQCCGEGAGYGPFSLFQAGWWSASPFGLDLNSSLCFATPVVGVKYLKRVFGVRAARNLARLGDQGRFVLRNLLPTIETHGSSGVFSCWSDPWGCHPWFWYRWHSWSSGQRRDTSPLFASGLLGWTGVGRRGACLDWDGFTHQRQHGGISLNGWSHRRRA